MSLKTNCFYDFGDFRLDLTEKILLRGGKPIPITPKVYQTLCVLVEDAERLIEKDELMRRIWHDRFVEESNLTFNIKMLRKALGDSAQKPTFIETVPRRGYRFIAHVRRVAAETEAASALNLGAPESFKSQISPAHHFTVERRRNASSVVGWQPPREKLPESESVVHSVSPAPRTFFGRCREIAAVENLLHGESARLVTLTGVGGSGKTTLARVVAENCAPDFPDGVFFVELAPIFNPELVAAAIAQTLGLKDSGDGSLPQTLQTFLQTRRALLVLDNFEQVASAADLLAKLLAATSRLKILVTSRVALRLSAENELTVPPLAVPPLDSFSALSVAQLENFSSVQMFVERARAAKPNFVLSVENAAHVTEICCRLDGLPLAIELAAARVKLLKPPEILRRLENSLQILTSRAEDLPARQRTMRDTIAWSFDLLGENEKTLFKRLAVFAGGFTLEAAEAICGAEDTNGAEILDSLESLIGGNLLQQIEERKDETRLLMLETIREYAAEQLAESAEEDFEMRRRHADFFLARVKQIERDLFGARQAALLDQMEADQDNFRRAMDWYRKTDGENELKLAAAFTPLWSLRGYLSEGIERLSEAIARNQNHAPAARAKALNSLGQLLWVKSDYVRTIALCEESLSIARQINYPMMSALSLFFAGMSYWYQYNNAEKSIAYLEESVRLYRELEFDSGVVFASVVLAAIYQTNNDLTRAARLLDASMAAASRTGNNLARSIALVNYGRLKFAEEDYGRAKQLCRESLRLREELSDRWGLVQCLEPLAAIAAVEGDAPRAAKILGAIDALLESLDASPPLIFRADHEPSLAAARAALDEKSFAASFAEGRLSSIEEIVAFALDDANNQPRDSEYFETAAHFSPPDSLKAKSTKNFKRTFAPPVEISAAPPSPRTKKSIYLTAAFMLIGIFAFGAWYEGSKNTEVGAPVLSAPFALEKLSTNGRVFHAAVSPDGKSVVYTNGNTGRQSVWHRQLETGNNVEIIPPSDDFYGGLAFSPDGNFLFFSRRPKALAGQLDIYRVSVFGGVPQKIIGETQGWIGVSPDGGKISFVRCYYREDENCSLWIADSADGKNERKLAARPHPLRIGDHEFSPDGKSIAFAAGQSENQANEFGLNEVDIESGAERELTAQKFFNIKSLARLPGSRDLLITASRISNKNFRIWQVSAATGDAVPLTNDSETYSTLSLDKEADVLVSTQVKQEFRLRIYPTENAAAPRVLADAESVAFAPNGKVIFSSQMTGNDEIWSSDADGGGQRQLTNNTAGESTPIASPDNNSIFFSSNRTGEVQVWRMNADGSSQTQITHTEGGFPLSVSPDGKWLYYHSGRQRTLWRVAVEDGEEQLILNKRKYYFAVSPDSLQVAFSENQGAENVLTIVSLTDGQTIKTFKFAAEEARLLGLKWSPDGKNLVYILAENSFAKNAFWRQPLDEKSPQRIADLGDEEMSELSGFALSPDGKSFVVAQGGWLHDAVLLRGLK